MRNIVLAIMIPLISGCANPGHDASDLDVVFDRVVSDFEELDSAEFYSRVNVFLAREDISLPLLRRRLIEGDNDNAWLAGEILGMIASAEALRVLREGLADGKSDLGRVHAANMLAYRQDTEAGEVLEAIVVGPFSQVQYSAAKALLQLDAHRGREAVRLRLRRSDDDWSATAISSRARLVSLLAEIGCSHDLQMIQRLGSEIGQVEVTVDNRHEINDLMQSVDNARRLLAEG